MFLWLFAPLALATAPLTAEEVESYGQSLQAMARDGCTPEAIAPFVDAEALVATDADPEVRALLPDALCALWEGAELDHGYVAEASSPERGLLYRIPVGGPTYGDKIEGYRSGDSVALYVRHRDELVRRTSSGPWLRYYRFGLGRAVDGTIVATRVEALHLGQDTVELTRLLSLPFTGAEVPTREAALLEARLWLRWGNVRAKVDRARKAAFVLPTDLMWESRRSIPVTCTGTGDRRCERQALTGWLVRTPAFARRASKVLKPLLLQSPDERELALEALRAAGRISPGAASKASAEIRPRFPGDASVALVAFNALVQQARFDEAETTLDDLEAAMGPDPYLHAMRGELALERGHWGTARKWCAKAVEQAPLMSRPYWTVIREAVVRKDHAVTAEWLSALRTATGNGISEVDLPELGYLKGFLASPEATEMVQQWRASAL